MIEMMQEARAPWIDAPPAPDQKQPKKSKARYSDGMSNKTADALDMAIPILYNRLADNQWHSIKLLDAVADDFRIGSDSLMNNARVAISESELWVALVGDSTPDDAPDETGA